MRGVSIGAMAMALSAPALASPPPADSDKSAQHPAKNDDGDAEQGSAPKSEIVVTARRLDIARQAIESDLGASTYTLTNEAVENRPGGETRPLGQILLQVPGVSAGPSSHLVIRGARGPTQYRINNVIIPEGAADFGETLSTRLAEKVELISGALPAQYDAPGGVVSVTSKNGTYQNGGQIEMLAGTHGIMEPAFEYAGSSGSTSGFVSGSYSTSAVGLAPPEATLNPAHDRTRQVEGFAFLDHVIDQNSRVSLILGTSDERFQIPNPAWVAAAHLDGRSGSDSHYAVASYQTSVGAVVLQASLSALASNRWHDPDPRAAQFSPPAVQQLGAKRDSVGAQIESAWTVNSHHTVRSGVTVTLARESGSALTYFGAAGPFAGSSTAEFGIHSERLASVFAQDEWRTSKTMTINFGGRIDSSNDSTHFSPRLNFVWKPSPSASLHAGFARYFVPAPISPVGLLPIQLSQIVPTGSNAAALKPETDDYFDAGIGYSSGPVTLGLDVYRRTARGLFDETLVPGRPLPVEFNFRTGLIEGADASLTYAAGGFSAWANLSYANGQDRGIASSQSAFSPVDLEFADAHSVHLSSAQRWTASGGIVRRLGRLQLSADAAYGSGYPFTPAGRPLNSATLPAYAVVNASAVYHIAGIGGRPLDLRLDLSNLLGSRYQLREGYGLAPLPRWGQPRTIAVGFEQSF